MGATSIRRHLLDDHRLLEHQMNRLMDSFEADDLPAMQASWGEFDARMFAHLDTEEQHLIPLLLQRKPRDARTIIEEHKHIRRRMVELGTAIDLHLIRLDALRGFLDELRAHARAEDRMLYDWADEQLSAANKTTILSDLARTLNAQRLRVTNARRRGAG